MKMIHLNFQSRLHSTFVCARKQKGQTWIDIVDQMTKSNLTKLFKLNKTYMKRVCMDSSSFPKLKHSLIPDRITEFITPRNPYTLIFLF